ncbi:MAG: class IV adenylate cyclase [Anaerolineae bacterium]|nr:MAG: class IV adenylate cyclase [Anaerolineae bacterium]
MTRNPRHDEAACRRPAGLRRWLYGPIISFERNVRFDTPDEALLRRQELLRLRQDARVRLTFKGPAAEDAISEAKVREEIELEVGDFDRMALILERLGLQPMQVYEKYRETYRWGNIEIVLDELPYGNFVELEGSEDGLKTVAAALASAAGRLTCRLLTSRLRTLRPTRSISASFFRSARSWRKASNESVAS